MPYPRFSREEYGPGRVMFTPTDIEFAARKGGAAENVGSNSNVREVRALSWWLRP